MEEFKKRLKTILFDGCDRLKMDAFKFEEQFLFQ